jgi:hypothetical protein
MTLPPEIQKQISDREDELIKDMKTDNDRNIGYYIGFCDGHEAGATEWAGKVQGYSNLLSEMRDCLSAVLMINDVRPLQDSELIEDINNALAKYKEVSNER